MDWFKMQTVWGSSIERMTDAEAGRFIKAVYAFVRSGVEYTGTGKEEMLVWQAIDTLRNDIAKFAAAQAAADDAKRVTSELRRQAANKRWQMQKDAQASKPLHKDAKGCKSMQKDAFASGVMQVDAKNAHKEKNKNKNNSNPPTPLADSIDDQELEQIRADHEEIFNAMEYAGFDMDAATLDKVIDLYATYGKEKVLSAIDACVENSVKKFVYLRGVLESREKEEKGQGEQADGEKPEDKVRWLD